MCYDDSINFGHSVNDFQDKYQYSSHIHIVCSGQVPNAAFLTIVNKTNLKYIRSYKHYNKSSCFRKVIK